MRSDVRAWSGIICLISRTHDRFHLPYYWASAKLAGGRQLPWCVRSIAQERQDQLREEDGNGLKHIVRREWDHLLAGAGDGQGK